MAETPPVLSLIGIRKSSLDKPVLEGVSITLHENECVGLLGINGTGKSTLMRIAAGAIAPDAGEIHKRRDLTCGYLDQSFDLDDEATVVNWIRKAFARQHALERELEEVHAALAEVNEAEHERLLARQSEIMHELEQRGAYDAHARMSAAMMVLGVPDGDRVIGTLSGGEKRRVALCRVLLERPDLLMLDEPTNHLDAETLEWLEEFLVQYPGTVMLVTHDRYFLDRVATRMIELERGQARTYQGNYQDYLIAKDTELQLAERAEENRRRTLRRELEWLGRQPKARTTKSKSRIKSIENLVASKPESVETSPSFIFPDAPRLGKTVIECEHVKKSLGGVELVKGFTFTMVPGDRIGIVGRNGAGKTTLLKMLIGEEKPDAGFVKHGQNVQVVYADQQRASLEPGKTVLEEVAGDVEWLRVGGERISVRNYLKRFLFDDQTAAMPVERLSGGERSRVLLAKLLRQGGNLVALDEPTNDLDLQTLRVLEDGLASFSGSALVVSHDRYFLNRVATRIFWLPGDGTVHNITGNYDDFRLYRARHMQALQERAVPETPAERALRPRSEEPRKKLSFNEQREFDRMEEVILEKESRAEELDALLHDPGTYVSRTRAEIDALAREREALKEEIARLYDRWAELSERAQ